MTSWNSAQYSVLTMLLIKNCRPTKKTLPSASGMFRATVTAPSGRPHRWLAISARPDTPPGAKSAPPAK